MALFHPSIGFITRSVLPVVDSLFVQKTLDFILPNGEAAGKAVGRADLAQFTALRQLAARVGYSAQLSSP